MKNTETVLFSKCWGKDWHLFLQGELDKKCDFKFDKKILIINNEVPVGVKFPCETIRVEDYIPEVLEFFHLTPDSFTRDGQSGFWYSMAELTALYFAEGYDYLVWCQGDCRTEGKWVSKGIEELGDKTVVVSPNSICNTWHDDNGYDNFFSDQAYLIPVKFWREANFNQKFKDIPEYPHDHGGDSFEKKCAQIMRLNNKRRKILYESYCHHG